MPVLEKKKPKGRGGGWGDSLFDAVARRIASQNASVPAPMFVQEPAPAPQVQEVRYIEPEPPPPPPRLLAESPEWLAYLNALGLEEAQTRADIDKRRAILASEFERQFGELPAVYEPQRRNITGALETRGMARSGELLRKLAENRAAQGRAESGLQAQYAAQIGSLESELAQKLSALAAKRAQQELMLRAQGYV